MKYLLIIMALAGIVFACKSPKTLTLQEAAAPDTDSVSYELIVLDPGFESWFLTRSRPANFYSQSYYEGWNQRYVSAWNYERIGFRYAHVIHGNIDYDPGTDYGLAINHKLFYYFQYVENELGIKLLPDSPKASY